MAYLVSLNMIGNIFLIFVGIIMIYQSYTLIVLKNRNPTVPKTIYIVIVLSMLVGIIEILYAVFQINLSIRLNNS